MTRKTGTLKKLWLGVGILALLSPLGLLLPAWLKSGGAWGEWRREELGKMLGFVPPGVKRLAELWKAPLSDYSLSPGKEPGLARQGLDYLLTGLLGIAVIVALVFLVGRFFSRKDEND
jgi:cobalt/nickel transport protein